jgi:hypothetical protein
MTIRRFLEGRGPRADPCNALRASLRPSNKVLDLVRRLPNLRRTLLLELTRLDRTLGVFFCKGALR